MQDTKEFSETTESILASLGSELKKSPSTTIEPTLPSSHHSPGPTSALEDKALQLLGAGVQQEAVASALGVTPAAVSQMLAKKSFADKVAALRFTSLQQHSLRDTKYDELEDRLINKLEKSLPLLMKPQDILKAITTINGAKRRGNNSATATAPAQTVINLNLPNNIVEKFSTNINNQVIKTGNQELLTISAANLLKQTESSEEVRVREFQQEQELLTKKD